MAMTKSLVIIAVGVLVVVAITIPVILVLPKASLIPDTNFPKELVEVTGKLFVLGFKPKSPRNLSWIFFFLF